MSIVGFFLWPFLLLYDLWRIGYEEVWLNRNEGVQAYSIPEEVYFLEDGSINPDWRIHQ
jgi:hypothetical protein